MKVSVRLWRRYLTHTGHGRGLLSATEAVRRKHTQQHICNFPWHFDAEKTKHMSNSVYLRHSPPQSRELKGFMFSGSPPPPLGCVRICGVGKPGGKEKEGRNFVIWGGRKSKLKLKLNPRNRALAGETHISTEAATEFTVCRRFHG